VEVSSHQMGDPNTREPARTAAAPSLATAVVPRMSDVEPDDQTGVAPGIPRSSKRPALVVVAGSSAGRVFPMEAEKVTVGRSKQAGFTLSDEGISRMHCGIAFKAGSYFLSDLGSTNGTLVNGGRADRVELRPGDRIQIGPHAILQFEFYDEAEDGLVNKLYEAATRDLLTRALNRRSFEERLAAELTYAVRHRTKLAAVAIDIDYFKTLDELYGHGAGDAVLSAVAKAIASALRNEDLFARVGAESFVVLSRGLSLRAGAKMAERIRKLIDDRAFELEEHRFRVTLSVGVAELSEMGRSGTSDELMQLANQRLAVAKAAGGNQVSVKS
jgi:two-component system, cell cycle response regulator